MWCIPGELDAEYVQRMENILNLLAKPIDPRNPVVCLDEKPVQLHGEVRRPQRARPGRIARRDSEYVRRGTANIFAVVAPKEGLHFTRATRNRKGPEFAKTLKRIAAAFPRAKKIHLVFDNLNTHCQKSLTAHYGQQEGSTLWNRFAIHRTPKHGSWLNPAEIEIGLLSRECMRNRRFADFETLRSEVTVWNRCSHKQRRTIEWGFRTRHARSKFRYQRHGLKITLDEH